MWRNAEQRAARTPAEWFAEATRWYAQEHQGCASCRGRHCVFRSGERTRVEYYCTACDFSACHDGESGLYFADLGEGKRPTGVLLGAEELWDLRSAAGVEAEQWRGA